MSPRVHWTLLATTNPMGQQRYEVEIQEAIRRSAGDKWEFIVSTVASLRAPVSANRRFPMQLLERTPVPITALMGRLRYPKADLVHRFDLRVPPGQQPEVVTVHDVAPLRFQDEGTMPRYALASARRATGVICPSHFAAEEVRAVLGMKRTWVIHNGISSEFLSARPLSDEERAALGLGGRYIVHAGGVTERKNLAALAEAWRVLEASQMDTSLVLCGPPHPRRDQLFAGLRRVQIPGRLPLGMVANIMAGAAAVVVPSTYEGFGLPALEGMAVGAPVVAASRGALPEVCGDAAELVEPTGRGIAEGLSKVLSDATESARLIALGKERAKNFDWDVAARAHLDVYREVLAG